MRNQTIQIQLEYPGGGRVWCLQCARCSMVNWCSYDISAKCQPVKYVAKRIDNLKYSADDKKLAVRITKNVKNTDDCDLMARIIRRAVNMYFNNAKSKK